MNTALISTFLWALFLFSWTTQAQDTALLEMIMDRMERMEAAMETKDLRIAALENKVKDNEKELKSLKGRMTETEETDLQLREMVDQVRNPPFAFQCAIQDGPWIVDNSVISYERLTYDDISGGSVYNVTGGMDISTGVFTVGKGFSGVWTVTYSITSRQDIGSGADSNHNYIYLFINGQKIPESRHFTFNDNSGGVYSQGSRTLHMRLEEGDKLTLRTGDVFVLYYITVCFQLVQII